MSTLVLVGDGPLLQTGLARISRDLATRIVAGLPGHTFVQVGLMPAMGQQWRAWPLWGFTEIGKDWGAKTIAMSLREVAEASTPPVVVLLNWDAARCSELLPYLPQLPVDAWWIYPPIDAAVGNTRYTGQPKILLEKMDRVLAYGRWASTVVKETLHKSCSYLPHGLDDHWFGQETQQEARERAGMILDRVHWGEDDLIIGCVAANQPRKDLGLYFACLKELRSRGLKVKGWIHADNPATPAWAIPQLIEDGGLKGTVVATTLLTDLELAMLYRCCTVTLAPGRGEGFGYPIVESLACGTPVVHADACGGAELVPMNAWRVPVRQWVTEGTFGVLRPILSVEDTVNALLRAVEFSKETYAADYCRGSVEYLRWTSLWPRWKSWLVKGLEDL